MPGRSLRPQASRAKNKKHTSIVTTVTPESPGIPYAMVLTVSFALSRVTGLVCHPRRRSRLHRLLTPASGRQDHTTSPSAGTTSFVADIARVHRIRTQRS